MSKPHKKPLIGIIGGIASGKSTVAAEFRKLGCVVIDADAIAHELLTNESVRQEIVNLFGREILDDAGNIQRSRLAERAFKDRQCLSALNAIVHPRVLRRTEELLARHDRDPGVPAVVLDMPLLVEVGWADRCDRLIFVKCDEKRRLARARQKGLLDERELRIRENFQFSLDTKAARVDNIVDNNSDFSALVRQIKDIFSEMTKN